MSLKKFRIAVFASGNGSNAEEIIRYFKGHQTIEVALVVTNNATAGVLDRAARLQTPSQIFTKELFRDATEVLSRLKQSGITHVVLAGFLLLIPEYLIKAFPDKIINIHPALLPKFGGKGMYGLKVHEAVKLASEKETGITIHLSQRKVRRRTDPFSRQMRRRRIIYSSTDCAMRAAARIRALSARD
jgi:phosphoribosylglycinamide formyltransferase-1